MQRRAALIFFSSIYTVLAAFASVIPRMLSNWMKDSFCSDYGATSLLQRTSAGYLSLQCICCIQTCVWYSTYDHRSNIIYLSSVFHSWFKVQQISILKISHDRYEADRFFFFYGVLIGLFLASSALGQMIAVLSPNVESAGLIFSTAVTTFIISSGFLLPRVSHLLKTRS